MSQLMVTAQELRSKAAELRQRNNQVRTQLNTMISNKNSVCNMWEGEAKDNFSRAFDHDKNEINDFIQTIEQYAAALESAAEQYERTERNNVNIAQNRTYH